LATSRSNKDKSLRPRRPPAITPDGRENQLIGLAVDLAEQQLKAGTASAQVISHFIKLGSSRERLEQERLAKENELLGIKADSIASAAKVEELYLSALNAMRSYSGQDPVELTDEEYND